MSAAVELSHGKEKQIRIAEVMYEVDIMVAKIHIYFLWAKYAVVYYFCPKHLRDAPCAVRICALPRAENKDYAKRFRSGCHWSPRSPTGH